MTRQNHAAHQRTTGVPPVPGRPHAVSVAPSEVSIAWHHGHARHGHTVHFDVFRDGRKVARVPFAAFTDRGLRPATAYRYAVRAVAGRHRSRRSPSLVVRTSALPPPRLSVPAGQGSGPNPQPAPASSAQPDTLTAPMVARMFWRAGFGPSASDLATWTGQQPAALVDHFLSTPNSLTPTGTPPTYGGNPIDPLASDPELVMEWLDTMQRSTNPFIERLTFFWHRHFAVSRGDGIPNNALLAYRNRLRRYADFSSNPNASFHDLALEMTTQDAAMCQYLTGNLNVKSAPNENYAREFMELFTLGITDAAGNPNYTQNDVHQLARCFTGWSFNYSAATTYFTPGNFDNGTKTVLGQTGNFDAATAVGIVLSQAVHAPFLVRKLWSEFIAAPIPGDALASLVAAYTAGGALALKPLLAGILSHPLIFDSLDEPDLIKPPVVYAVGVQRALGAPLKDRWQYDALNNMQQVPYYPPNVAGWEGGLSWLTSGTAQARFDHVVRCQGLLPAVSDVPAESPQQAYARAYASCGSPWLSAGAQAALLSYAQSAPTATAAQRRERQYALQALMLGGPDGQVS